MESMSVKPAMVIELAGRIRSGASGIQSQLDDLDGEVSKLRESWSGDAQSAYDTAHAEWTKSIQAMNALLQRIGAATEEMSQGYTASDNSSANRFSG